MFGWSLVGLDGFAGLVVATTVVVVAVVLLRRGIVVRIRHERDPPKDDN